MVFFIKKCVFGGNARKRINAKMLIKNIENGSFYIDTHTWKKNGTSLGSTGPHTFAGVNRPQTVLAEIGQIEST